MKSMTFKEKDLDIILTALEYFNFEENYDHKNYYVKQSKRLIKNIKEVLLPIEELSKTLKS